MELFLLGLFCGVVLVYVALKLVIWWATKKIREASSSIDKLVEKVKTEINESIITARVEEINGVFYVYSDKNEFLAQGTTLTELRERISSRKPDTNVIIKTDNKELAEKLKATEA